MSKSVDFEGVVSSLDEIYSHILSCRDKNYCHPYPHTPEQSKKIAELHSWFERLEVNARNLLQLASDHAHFVSFSKAETQFQFVEEIFDTYKKQDEFCGWNDPTDLMSYNEIKGMLLSKLFM